MRSAWSGHAGDCSDDGLIRERSRGSLSRIWIMNSARIVLVTAPDADCASQLARGLVEARLVACVNLIDGVRSIYRWGGAVEEAREVLMVIKTVGARVPEIERWLAEQHPYDVPEIVAIEPASVEASYLAWLRAETAPEA
ncbi:MAG: periplasmic divalent cation tolerance protein [Planctomycetota bacterium]|jgi:periplasmic divalent cation tolerance protein